MMYWRDMITSDVYYLISMRNYRGIGYLTTTPTEYWIFFHDKWIIVYIGNLEMCRKRRNKLRELYANI